MLGWAGLLAACAHAAEPNPVTQPAPKAAEKANGGVLPAKYQGRPLLWVPKSAALEKLDGELTDEAWKKAAKVQLNDIYNGAKPKVKTELLIFCTDDALHLGFQCEEPKLEELKLNEGEIWSRDEVEIFFEPAKDTLRKCYHQVIVDAGNDTWKGRCHIYPKYKHQQLREEWSPQLETAAAKGDKSWSLEIKIPFAEMAMNDAAKGKKTLWRFNANRLRPGKGGEDEQSMSWAVLGEKFFHNAGKFGYMLPEVYATPELLEKVRAEAGLQAEAPVLASDPAIAWEVRKRIGELESEVFSERDAATRRIRQLAEGSQANAESVIRELELAAERARDSQVKGATKTLLAEIRAAADASRDDDPPPDHIRQQGTTLVFP